jgi:hypothetical protein
MIMEVPAGTKEIGCDGVKEKVSHQLIIWTMFRYIMSIVDNSLTRILSRSKDLSVLINTVGILRKWVLNNTAEIGIKALNCKKSVLGEQRSV